MPSLHDIRRCSSRAALLLVSLMLPAHAHAQRGTEIPELSSACKQLTDELLAQHEDPRAHYVELWRSTSAAHGTIEPLIIHLRALERDERRILQRNAIRRLLTRIFRRAGRTIEAIEILDRLEPDFRTAADRMAKAEMLDAEGRDQEALKLYEELLPKIEDAELRKRILLRMALMGKGTEKLAAFAKDEEHSVVQRNEAAIILALRGDQKSAIESFVSQGEGTSRFRQEIRRAEWAIEAKLFDEAQKASWLAVRSAKLSRDRKYALSVLASSYRRDGAVDELLERFEKSEELSRDARELWVRLLREEGRADDALRLFREAPEGSFDASMRRQLLEICRETGRADVLISAFERLIREDPQNLEWRSGLSRYYLEQGLRPKALAVWKDIKAETQQPKQLMEAAFSLQKIGLDDVARQLARQASKDPDWFSRGLLFIFNDNLAEGRQEEALTVLRELEAGSSGSSTLAAVADGYERLGRPELAVATLERLRESLGGYLGSDLEMKLAILLSRVQRDEDALEIWRGLWSRLRSTPRGRFVEDRMMTVASRTGTLARIAIELEDRLSSGNVDAEGIEMLVRLYIKVGDPASATEIVEEYMNRQGGDEIELLKRKSKIYLACQDYHHYEKVIHELVERDEENRIDHLRELAMSNLERGRRDLAVDLLPRIREASDDSAAMADEFEAGVYGLSGMKEEALAAYVRGMGRNPGRIDTYLLISNLMRETGNEMGAAKMFQYLAQTAPKDDLFTIAIDGILNLRAHRGTRVPLSVVRWAQRTTLERLAAKPNKFYLYRLVTDLASELNDMPFAIRALKAGLPVAGERRTPILREIMAKARSTDPNSRSAFGAQGAFKPSPSWDATDYVMVGRRLLGQGDHVPPQTFMNLASVFLREKDVDAAVRTFNRAAEVLDYAEVLREAARVLEAAGRPKHALQYYQRLLAAGGDDVALIQKIASLEEQMGDRSRAFEFYSRGMSRILSREPRYVSRAENEPEGPIRYYGGNVSIEDQLLPKFVEGMVLSASEEDVLRLVTQLEEEMLADLATVPEDPGADAEQHGIANYPRLAKRMRVWRRLVLSREMLDRAAKLDAKLMQGFPQDASVSVQVLRSRAQLGLEKAARTLLAASPLESEPRVRLAAGVVDAQSPSLSVAAAARLVVPILTSEPDAVRELLERVDTGGMTSEDKAQLGNLLSACVLVDASAPAERIARAGLRTADVRREIQLLQDMLSMAARISPDLAKRLLREKLKTIADEEPTAMLSFVRILQQLDATLGGDAISSESAKELIKKLAAGADRSRPYIYFTSLLDYVDTAERTVLVRELHGLLSPTQRPRLLLDSIQYLDADTIEPSFVEWFARSLKVALEAGGENVVRSISVSFLNSRPGGGKRSAELTLAALDVVDEFQPSVRNSAERIGVLLELDKIDEAFEYAEGAVDAMLADQQMGRYAFQRMTSFLSREDLRERTTAFLKKVQEKHPKEAQVRSALRRVQEQDSGNLRAQLLATLEEDPKDLSAWQRLWSIERRSGSDVRAMRALEQLTKLQPQNSYYQTQLASHRQRLLHPTHIEALLEAKSAKEKAAAEAAEAAKDKPKTATSKSSASGARRVAAARSVPAARLATGRVAALRTTGAAQGLRLVSPTGTVSFVSGGVTRRIRVDPKAREILELHKKGETDEARRLFRRLWRNFDPQNRYIVFPRNLRPGFFKQFGDALPFLYEEALAVLRVLPGQGTELIRAELYDIVAAELVKQKDGTQQEIARRSQAVLAGTASTREVEVLLRLLDAQEKVSIEPDLLHALLRRLEPLDSERLERLARLCAKCGEKAEGARLFRLATLSNTSAALQLAGKVESIQELFGDESEQLISELVDDLGVRMQGYRFSQWANMAVDIWSRVLSPERAAQRMKRLQEQVRELSGSSPMFGSRTPRGDLVALTFARAGLLEDALSELAVWMRKKQSADTGVYNRVNIPAQTAIARALSEDGEWKDRAAWLTTLTESLLAWHEADDLRSPDRVLSAVAQALWKSEQQELAQRCVERMLQDEAPNAAARIARAAILRTTGNEERAWGLEQTLLSEEALPVARIAPLLEQLRKTEGVERALELGSEAAEYTWKPELLDLLASCAEELGQEEQAKAWRAKHARVLSVLPKKVEPKTEGESVPTQRR
jgi:tetratricopeptide (TPR) repeat protein